MKDLSEHGIGDYTLQPSALIEADDLSFDGIRELRVCKPYVCKSVPCFGCHNLPEYGLLLILYLFGLFLLHGLILLALLELCHPFLSVCFQFRIVFHADSPSVLSLVEDLFGSGIEELLPRGADLTSLLVLSGIEKSCVLKLDEALSDDVTASFYSSVGF